MGIKLIRKHERTENMVRQKNIKRFPMLRWAFIVLLVSLPFCYLLYEFSKEYFFVRYHGYISYETLVVRAPINSYIEKLNVKIGQKIKPGDFILNFLSPEINMSLEYLKREKIIVETSMNFFINQDMQALKNAIKVAKDDIKVTQEVYDKFWDYHNQGTIVSLQLEAARLNWANAKRLYYNLKEQLDRINRDRNHLGEVYYRRKIAEINRDINIKQALQSKMSIYAKQNLFVISIDSYQSEFVPEGRKVLTTSTEKSQYIIGFIPPEKIGAFPQGTKVQVQLPDKIIITGIVAKKPSFARRLPVNFVNPLSERTDRIVLIITIDKKLEKNYLYGAPVSFK